MGVALETLGRFSTQPIIDLEHLPTPDDVRGLSLGEVGDQYYTPGLYVRLQDSLERAGLTDLPGVADAVELGLFLHRDDRRTNGHQQDHLMRVTTRIIDHYGIHDHALTIAGVLHDSVEEHVQELAYTLSGGRERIESVHLARTRAFELLTERFGEEPAEIIRGTTNPIVGPGEDKRLVYAKHMTNLIYDQSPYAPKIRVLKLSDFTDNGVGNHHTIGEKQLYIDFKYLGMYSLHRLGLRMPGGLIQGELVIRIDNQLRRGEERAFGRLAVARG